MMNHTQAALLLDSLQKELDSWRNGPDFSHSKDGKVRIDVFKVELKFLRTFLVYVENWDGAAKGAGHLGSLIFDIRAGLKELKKAFRAASKKGIERSREQLNAAISKFREKVMAWRPQIKAAYDYVESSYWIRPQSPLSNYDLWVRFCGSVEQNLLDLLSWNNKLPTVIGHQLNTMNEMLGALRYFLRGLIEDLGIEQRKVRYLLTHFGAVLVCTAHVSYLCWVDIHSLDEIMAKKLSDLLKKFKPHTPLVIEGCLDALLEPNKTTGLERFARFLFPEKYQADLLGRGLGGLDSLVETRNKMPYDLHLLKNFTHNTVFEGYLDTFRPSDKAVDLTTQLELFCRFLFFSDKYQDETLNKGLGQLVLFVFYSYIVYKVDAVKMVLFEIVAAFCELGYYLSKGHETTREGSEEIDPPLNKLLQKIMLLVMEAFLTNLNFVHLKFIPTEKWRFDAIQGGLSFFRNFLGELVLGPVWIYIENVVSSVGLISHNAHSYQALDEKNPPITSEQLFRIRILKMEILLEELLNGSLSLLPDVKNQVEDLYEALVLVRTFLMVELGENEELNLTHVKAVLSDAISVFYSLQWNEITEDSLQKFTLMLPVLSEKVKLVAADMKEMYRCIRSSLPSCFPKTEGFGFMDFLIRDLEELLNSKDVSVNKVIHQIRAAHKDMELLRSFLRCMGDQNNEDSEFKSLVSHIVDVAFQVECITDSFVCGDGVQWYHVIWLSDLIEDLRHTKIQASEISKFHGISIPTVVQSTSRQAILQTKISLLDEVVVDLVDENESITDRLTRGSSQLDVVPIVGMAGIGKSTLARKLYNNASLTYHFHVRAWCYVSQVYQKRKLLLEILGDIVEVTDDILGMNDEDLCLELYRSLKGKRYLIVMDDIWSIEAWNDLERTFPNDNNGSRILITSRLNDVAEKTKADSNPHQLRLLSIDESWELLQRKLFKTEGCPDELMDLGKQIASCCEGLPLAVVAISGILQRTDRKPDWWKRVAATLSSLIGNDPESRCMDILELSYKHLPTHLKTCFLYLGAFMENKEIPVRKLLWLWVAEGFIQNAGGENVEDVAEEYLTDLIGRSLVMASKRRSKGGVKTCRVHDMLRTLCSLMCKEESFLEQVTPGDQIFSSLSEELDFGVHPNYRQPKNPVTYREHRLSIYCKRNHFIMSRISGPHVHTLLHSAISDLHPMCPYDISFIPENFKRLRVLDVECINMGQSFPIGIEVLVRLRFLALSGDVDHIPDSIANLRNLQTLVLVGLKGIVLLPNSIWSMEKLQHLHVKNGAAFNLEGAEMDNPPQLGNLVSLSSLTLSGGQEAENILRRLPGLRKLKCTFSEGRDHYTEKWNQFPALDFLKDLESLKVIYSGRNFHPRRFDFPSTLRKLTLSKFRLPWSCISEIGKLPNIEVLKLLSGAFDGKTWDMEDGEFLKLKYLKLDTLNIVEWNASCDNLPNLQHVVLRSCWQLEEAPSDFGYIPTLESIEVQMCRSAVEESVKNIKLEQMEMGNKELKILINRSDWDV